MLRASLVAALFAASLTSFVLVACGGDDSGATSSGDDAGSDATSGGDDAAQADGGASGDGASTSDAGTCLDATVTIGDTTHPRGGNTPALVRSSYDYAPTVLHDGNYRMWWCGGIAGDHVLYAEASSLDGPWHAHASATPNTFDDVLQPTGVVGDFDGAHTCDPSVIRVDGTYYLYYGGLGQDGTPNNTTRLGLATSPDGFTFARQNGGKPIINPAQSLSGKPNNYGAGQPSAFYKDGYFYLSFTDTSASGANPVNGAGQFVVRSKDATFQTGVEELGTNGFAPQVANTTRPHSLTEAFSPDWTYVPAVDMYMMAVDGTAGIVQLRFFDTSFQAVKTVSIPGDWSEGPGLVKRPDGQLDPSASCDTLSVDVMRAVGSGTDAWDLAHAGADVPTGRTCSCVPWPSVLEGTLVTLGGQPLTLVRGGKRLQFALAAPAHRLARTELAVTSEIFGAVPYGAGLHAGDPAVGAAGRPAAFKLDNDTLWPASCLEVFTDNGSTVATITTAAFDALPAGPSLYCVK